MTTSPIDIIKSNLSYIELSELNFIEFDTALSFFGIVKHNSLMEASKKNRGIFVYDLNTYLEKHRIIKNSNYACPFIGLCAVSDNNNLKLERLMRKSDIMRLLRYPPFLFNILTEKCPYYVFSESPIKYYRRIEIHYTIYRMSVTIDSLDTSEDNKNDLAKAEWLKKIVFSSKIEDKGGSRNG